MLKKILVVIAVAFSGYCLANDEVRPILKEYPAPHNINLYPLKNKITPDLIIRTPCPKGIAPAVPLYMYDEAKHKLISFSWENRKPEIQLFKFAFGLEEAANNKDSLDFRKGLIGDNKIIQVKLNKPTYQVFAVISNTENKYNLYIFSERENIVSMLAIDNFSKKEAEEMLGTMKVIGENNE